MFVTARGGDGKGTMRVCIEDVLTVECSHVIGQDWNGFAVPVFTAEQLAVAVRECEAVGFVVRDSDGVAVDSEYLEPVVRDLGHGEFVLGEGWVWDVEEWEVCDDCGRDITPVAGCVGLFQCGC